MRYMLLIYTDERTDAQPGTPGFDEMATAYNAFGEEVRARGVFQTGEALLPTSMATTVRVRNDQRLTTDGPFAETKEQLGGFYILNCKDLDEALEFAAKIPGAKTGSIEVRPIMEFE
jgi:hypothetical protein